MKFFILILSLAISSVQAGTGMWTDATLPSSISNSHNGFDTIVTPQGRQLVVHTTSNTKLMLSERVSPISNWTTAEIFNAQLFSIRDVEFLSDDEGGLHVAFLTRGSIIEISTALRYGYRNPEGVWSFTILEDANPSDSYEEGHELSLDLQSNGLAAIAYTGENGTLRYIARSHSAFGAWFDSVVDESPDSGLFPSLKHRSSFTETTFISHYDEVNQQLLFTSLSRPFGAPKFSWSTSTVDNLNNPGRYSSLDFTASGQVAIAYNTTFLGRELRFAVRDGGVWNREVVDAPLDDEQIGMHCHLSMDALGKAQITYTSGSFFIGEQIETYIEEIRHARALPDGSWGIESANCFDGDSNSFRMNIATDLAGTPHAIYFHGNDNTAKKLRHLRPYGSSWVSEDITGGLPQDAFIRGASLDFASDGTRVISVPTTSDDPAFPEAANRLYLMTEKDGQSKTAHFLQGGRINSTRTIVTPDNRIESFYRTVNQINIQERKLAGLGTSAIGHGNIALTNDIDFDVAIDANGTLHLVMDAGDSIAYFTAAPVPDGQELVWERQAEEVPFGEGRSPAIAIGPANQVVIVYLAPDGLFPNPAPGQSEITHAFFHPEIGGWEFNSFEEGSRLGRSLDVTYCDAQFKVVACEFSEDETSTTIFTSNPFTGERHISHPVAGQVLKIDIESHNDQLHVCWRSEYQSLLGNPVPRMGHRYIGYFSSRQGPTVVRALPVNYDIYSRTFDNLDLAIDQEGFPVILTNAEPDNDLLQTPGSLLLFRPADSLDLDNDGISLLYESAFGMNPRVHDPETGGRNTVRYENGQIHFNTYFRHRNDLSPLIGSGPVLNETNCYLGAFELGMQYSTSGMKSFTDNAAIPILLPSQDLPDQAGFVESGTTLTFGANFVEHTPKAFFRHTVRRIFPKIN